MSYLKFSLLIHNFCKTIFEHITDLLFSNYKNTEILYKSDNFIIINKAHDIKINSNNNKEVTIQTFMKKKQPSLASNQLHHEYYFMHRLDYSTSGLMCIPIHKRACQVASKAIEQRHCKKYYVALVRGYPSLNLLDLNFPIGRDTRVKEIEKMCVPYDDSNDSIGKSIRNARTLIKVLEIGLFDNYPTTKILIRPITGRRHQIRVHCSHIGHTIVGDYTYSNKKDVKPKRMYLHSIRLIIPNDLENINIETNDPFTEKDVQLWKPAIRHCNLDQGFEEIDGHFYNHFPKYMNKKTVYN